MSLSWTSPGERVAFDVLEDFDRHLRFVELHPAVRAVGQMGFELGAQVRRHRPIDIVDT